MSNSIKNDQYVYRTETLVQFHLNMSEHEGQSGLDEAVVTRTRPKTSRPSLYKVLLLNDDFTPMDFVMLVLKKFFAKPENESHQIMMRVHHEGSAIAGVYTFEVAETKVYLVNEFARRHKFPLKCVMEKDQSPADNQ